MERDEVLAMMTTLKLAGMRTAYDDTLADGLKRRHPVHKIIGALLRAEIADKTARSNKYQMASARLPAAKELAEFDFAASPVNEPLIRDLAMGVDPSNARRTGQIISSQLSDPRGPLQIGGHSSMPIDSRIRLGFGRERRSRYRDRRERARRDRGLHRAFPFPCRHPLSARNSPQRRS